MLRQRILTALVAIPVVIFVTYWGYIPFFLFMLALVIFGLLEFYRILESRVGNINKGFGVTGGVLLIISIYFAPFSADARLGSELVSFIFTAFILVLLSYFVIKREIRHYLYNVGAIIFGLLYIGWLLSYMILLREIRPGGRYIIFYLLFLVWIMDTASYLGGMRFGKHKLIKMVSPHKTIEGSVFGIVFAIITSIILSRIWINYLQMNIFHSISLGIILGIAGQIGDLSESLLKRNLQLKDTSTLFPGHGGILDRCDSFLFAAPVLYYYMKWFVL